MKSSIRTTLLALALAGTPLPVLADSGFFVSGSIGSSTFEDDIENFRLDTDTTAYRLTAGLQIGNYLGVEGGYHSFGKYDESFDIGDGVTDISLQADGWTLGLVAGIPVSESFSLFGRGGAFFWDADARIDDVVIGFPEDTDWYWGGGADVRVTERLSLLGDWTRYEFEGAKSDVISIGFKFVF
ncbi:MAG: porin family protein [Woeseiaceae bacterium]|nr:porin family protein [Woeseiaceae bacterium]